MSKSWMIFMECGGEGWWRCMAVLEMGWWAKRFFVLLVCCVFLWAVQDDSHDFLEGDGGGRGG